MEDEVTAADTLSRDNSFNNRNAATNPQGAGDLEGVRQIEMGVI